MKRSAMFADPNVVTFVLTYSGAVDHVEHRYFYGGELNDATELGATKICEYGRNPNVTHAYVSLSRLADDASIVGRAIMHWIKPDSAYASSLGRTER